ncbi:branched-chain amino acid ABC transporter permease [Tepidanaerobacter syntrophicus]|uniref:branched-chain amino acid ABC transporter permease n=1 Tax=Tepidanaerobacter syntrophicus TaxID=224999 RepID=UPI001BD1EF1D|nr:branched-chain amino acid ABC transporter permease [Tepidanaerobacter syntrophicus]
MNNYVIGVLSLTGIYMIAILGVSILTGFTGLFSMGHAGFMAIGAYVSALVTKSFGISPFFGVFLGMLAATAVGLAIGYPTLKLKGDYFVIATLGIGEVVRLIIENLPSVTGGARGMADIPRGSSFSVVWVTVIVLVMLLRNFLYSKHGRNCIAVREEELAASAIGINVANYKLLAMGISCALCGISGGLLAHYMRYLNPSMFSMAKSNELAMTVILGGCGSLTGTVIASLILVPLPEILRFGSVQEWRMVFYGLLVTLVIIFKPSGLLGNREFSLADLKNVLFRTAQRFLGEMPKGGKRKNV